MEPEHNSEFILSTLDKGLRVLEALAETEPARGLTLTELARVVGMHRTTLFRILATLRARGYVARDSENDRYRLGLQLLSLSSALLNDLDMRQVARPILQALRDETQELVHLTVLDNGEVVTIDRFEGNQPLSLQTEIGGRRPAYCTATGKSFLANMPAAEVDRLLEHGMPRLTRNTITSSDAMQQHLAETRRRGYAIDNEERTEGIRCVAAPIFDHDRRIVGAVSIAAPALRTPEQRLAYLGRLSCRAADQVSHQLGYSKAGADGKRRSLDVVP
ncbi:MAG TPA: IclR family transcriptional regulator [Thermomicrobiales bacterium]|nr:IclR family transcriptional regulator [Thermomicrobiales bacterium]